MKKLITIFILYAMCQFPAKLLAQKLSFSYDASGNQIERRWVCINCRPAQGLSIDKQMAISKVIDGNGGNEITAKSLKVFPNPVAESVNISWSLPNKAFVKTMNVYAMGGNRVHSSKYGAEDRNTLIDMAKMPPGTYLLVIKYSDESSESVKLIKI